jgi:hypothetical protein
MNIKVETAREKSIIIDNETRTAAEDQKILDDFYSGKICLMRRAPMRCICKAEMWAQYIGHRDFTSEWHYKCNICGYELFG